MRVVTRSMSPSGPSGLLSTCKLQPLPRRPAREAGIRAGAAHRARDDTSVPAHRGAAIGIHKKERKTESAHVHTAR